jgi:hypothetical protein
MIIQESLGGNEPKRPKQDSQYPPKVTYARGTLVLVLKIIT